MPRYTGPDAVELMELLDPPVKRALKLIDWMSHPSRRLGWPCDKTDGKYIITVERRPLMNQYVVNWSTQSPPAPPWLRLVARLLGVAIGDQLTLTPDQSVSTLDIDNSALKCRVIYWSEGYPGTISILGRRAKKVTPRDVITYLQQHPLPTIPTEG